MPKSRPARSVPFPLLLGGLLLAACGGGGGGPAGTARVSGRLVVAPAAVVAVAQRASPVADLRDGAGVARARALADGGEAVVALDAADPRAARRVLRVVAGRGGPVGARCEPGPGLRVRFALHHLDRDESGPTLDVAPGDVFDVVVWAVEGRGVARVRIDDARFADRGEARPPAGYRDDAPAHRPGELLVRMAPGRRWEELPDAAGLSCVERGGGWCRLRVRAAAGDGFPALARLLARAERMRRGGPVEAAEPLWTRRLQAEPDDPRFADQWALEQIRAPSAWELDRGEAQVVVATIDSGIKHGHPDLQGRILPGYDFLDDDDDPEDPRTGFSHGTQTAGIVAAAADNGEGVAGVLWDGRVLPLRAFDENGFGDSFDIAQAIRYAAGLANSSGTLPAVPARVINASFASDTPTDVERDAVAAARGAGVLVVAASGNTGTSARHYPAAYEGVLAVGATTSTGIRAVYSNFGDWLDVVAPGGTIGNGVLAPSVDSSGAFNYQAVNGTSFAAPHVAGVAALVLGVRDYEPDALQALLRSTAQDIGAPGIDLFTGSGVVHAWEALRIALDEPTDGLIPGERVEVRIVQVSTGRVVASTTTSRAAQLDFALDGLAADAYRLEAGTDRDFDGAIDDPGELYGRWTDALGSDRLDLADGEVLTDLQITLTLRA